MNRAATQRSKQLDQQHEENMAAIRQQGEELKGPQREERQAVRDEHQAARREHGGDSAAGRRVTEHQRRDTRAERGVTEHRRRDTGAERGVTERQRRDT